MLRFFLILLLCALFAACSSDDSTALKEWFDDQKIATSYGKLYQEIDVSLNSSVLGYDSSTYMVSSFAALGNVNNIEHKLYFSLEVVGELDSVWKLKPDSIFYANFHKDTIPEEHKKVEARFYWLKENKTEYDSADISIDSFSVSLPKELLNLKADTLRLQTSIKLLTNNAVLRIAPPTISDIPGLLYVEQKALVESCGDLCLHGGVRESLDVVLNANGIKTEKTVVFAQLVLQKSSDTKGSELEFPVPVYVYNEEYKVDSAFIEAHGHPNLVFWEGDTLKLQVTKKLRHYAPDTNTFGFTLRLGNPMLNPKSFSFSNIRPAYSSYDFSTAFEGAKLRLWYAETD